MWQASVNALAFSFILSLLSWVMETWLSSNLTLRAGSNLVYKSKLLGLSGAILTMALERGKREQLTRRGEFQVAWQLLNCLVLCSPEWFPSRIVTRRDELGQDRCVHAKWTKSRLFCGEHEKRENSGLLLLFSHVPSVRGGTFNTTQCIFVLPFFTSFFFS